MFGRIFTLLSVVALFALFAVTSALPTLLRARDDSTSNNTDSGNSGQCNTGNVYCCNQVTPPSNDNATKLILEYGIEIPSLPGLPSDVGLGCTPITALGMGQGASCTQQPVCCADNSYNGVINIGCSPISA